MKAFIFERTGEPADVLAVRDLPNPTPGPGEVRVRLSPVHPADLHLMRGRFGRQPALPASPGVECVGVVEALGPGTPGPAPGTRVVLLDVWSTWRELVGSPVERVVPVPGEVSDENAAQAIVNPMTAWIVTMVEHRMEPGQWLTQTAAGSTVGRLVLQLARSENFRTINIVRRRAQVAEIADLGGNVTLCTEDRDWPAQLVKAGDGRGHRPKRSTALPGGSAPTSRGLLPWAADCWCSERCRLIVRPSGRRLRCHCSPPA